VLVEDVARDALAAVNGRANLLLAARWTALRYQEVASRYCLRHLRRVGETVVPGAVTGGTMSVVRGDALVVGDGEASAAWAAVKPEIDAGRRAFRAATTWYTAVGVESTGELRLATPYAEPTTAGAGYVLVTRYALIEPTVRQITAVGVPRLQRPLRDTTATHFADLDPTRSRVGAPEWWAEATPDPNGRRRLEVYPYCQHDEFLSYLYYPNPPALGLRDPLPPGIDGSLLKEGVLVDIKQWEAAEAARAGQVELAAYWRNEYRAQETRWRETMGYIAQADQGADDMDILLVLRPDEPGYGPQSARTAYDYVWNR
jgi:hypothetical protein